MFLYLLDKVVKDWKDIGIIETNLQGLRVRCKLADIIQELCNENRPNKETKSGVFVSPIESLEDY